MSKFKQYVPALAAVLMVVIGLILLFVQKNKQPEQYKEVYIDTFDTVTQYIGYAESEELFNEHAKVLNDKLLFYHKLFNIYNTYDGINNLKTINLNAGVQPVKVEKEIIDLLKFSITYYEKTNGQINVAMGSVLNIWHNYRTAGINDPQKAALPSYEKLQEASEHCNISDIIIDEDASTVYLADPDMSLDVGSIGKGYAVQLVADYARELGYDNLIINCGGNVAAIGTKPNKDLWTFGIQNPDLEDENTILTTVSFSDKCLVTSGDYQRYYVVDGIEYCHIIDPDTLMPAEHFKAVSIITSHSGMADALSTALFNMTYEEGLELIDQTEDAEAIWVLEDGSIKYSAHFKDYMTE